MVNGTHVIMCALLLLLLNRQIFLLINSYLEKLQIDL